MICGEHGVLACFGGAVRRAEEGRRVGWLKRMGEGGNGCHAATTIPHVLK